MATQIIADHFEAARAKALSHAACEITAIAQTLNIVRSHKGVHCFENLLPGALMRIELLGTCVGVLADKRTDAEEIEAQYDMVLGEKLEVAHD
jgi:hypothetical protein